MLVLEQKLSRSRFMKFGEQKALIGHSKSNIHHSLLLLQTYWRVGVYGGANAKSSLFLNLACIFVLIHMVSKNKRDIKRIEQRESRKTSVHKPDSHLTGFFM